MIYGKNFLPTIPGRWTLANSTMTDSKMTINAGGWTAAFIEQEDISLLPESMRLTIITSEYTDAYNPANFVDISIITETEEYIEITCPIVNTGNGVYTADIELRESEYTQFRVVIRSMLGMEVTSWRLAAPIGGDNTAIIEELRGELPRLLYDYNTTPLTVDHKERTIALVSAWLVKDTDLNGHIQLTYTATHNTRLHIRCKGNDVSELFTPVIYDITPGRGSIGIPHAYLQKKVGYHTFTVSAQVEEGAITFATRAIIYTIDGGHLASRVQDVGMDVRDITLRRTAEEREPSWIYAIGIDDGEAMVKARPHSDVAATAWEPQLTIGESKEAAIEFDGLWELKDSGQWWFNTDNDPWVFWVDNNNILWSQIWDDEGTKFQLAEDVVKISSVMGWRNPTFIDQDQGMIMAYIKSDGLAYYRNYCILPVGEKTWEIERNIEQFKSTAVDIYTFRTNDYRVGFSILDVGGNTTTLLTERNWAGMAITPEKFSVRAEAKVDLIPVTYHRPKHDHIFTLGAAAEIAFLFGRTDNSLIDVKNVATTRTNEAQEEYQDYGFAVEITLNYKTVTTPTITIRDSKTLAYYNVLEVQTIRDGYEYRAIIDDTIDEFGFNIAEEKLTINITGFSNAAGYNYDTINQEFTPTGLEAPMLGVPEVEVIWNE